MSDAPNGGNGPENDNQQEPQVSRSAQIGRLQGIKQHLQSLNRKGFGYLSLPNLYALDPVGQSPHIVPETFIAEEVGGNITVLETESEESLAEENINQMLRNYLPGGYKQRWGSFDLWRGAWHHETAAGHADIGPMFDWRNSYPLTELLGEVDDVAYTELSFDPDAVTVYVPRAMHVTRLNKHSVQYAWLPDRGIVTTGNPPERFERLSSDPTTNYLWFKHAVDDFDTPETPLDESRYVSGFRYADEHLFVRCYYASLLTLYPRDTTRVKTGIMRYRNEADDADAFVASRERSQLLTFDLERSELRERLEELLQTNGRLKRNIQFAYLRYLIGNQLFFQDEALDHAYQIGPLVEHLIGADYWERVEHRNGTGVFPLSGPDLIAAVERLLPEESQTRLRLLGHDRAESSAVVRIIREHTDAVARILALCRNDSLLLDFAEDALVHSAEHALSGWANELTGSGTSFELWYDVNFQSGDAEEARISVYDPIQGGAGIAKEVYGRLKETPLGEINVDHGLARQGRCHSATADLATIRLLAAYPDGSLYDVFTSDREQFLELVKGTIEEFVDDSKAYSMADLQSQVDQRVSLLFETRELARFYSYIAGLYDDVEEAVGRTPRPADLVLELDRHVFRDPQTRATYERFATDSGRRDIAELSERIEELTVQCISACPDCLKMDDGICIKNSIQQTPTLSRQLLVEVFSHT